MSGTEDHHSILTQTHGSVNPLLKEHSTEKCVTCIPLWRGHREVHACITHRDVRVSVQNHLQEVGGQDRWSFKSFFCFEDRYELSVRSRGRAGEPNGSQLDEPENEPGSRDHLILKRNPSLSGRESAKVTTENQRDWSVKNGRYGESSGPLLTLSNRTRAGPELPPEPSRGLTKPRHRRIKVESQKNVIIHKHPEKQLRCIKPRHERRNKSSVKRNGLHRKRKQLMHEVHSEKPSLKLRQITDNEGTSISCSLELSEIMRTPAQVEVLPQHPQYPAGDTEDQRNRRRSSRSEFHLQMKLLNLELHLQVKISSLDRPASAASKQCEPPSPQNGVAWSRRHISDHHSTQEKLVLSSSTELLDTDLRFRFPFIILQKPKMEHPIAIANMATPENRDSSTVMKISSSLLMHRDIVFLKPFWDPPHRLLNSRLNIRSNGKVSPLAPERFLRTGPSPRHAHTRSGAVSRPPCLLPDGPLFGMFFLKSIGPYPPVGGMSCFTFDAAIARVLLWLLFLLFLCEYGAPYPALAPLAARRYRKKTEQEDHYCPGAKHAQPPLPSSVRLRQVYITKERCKDRVERGTKAWRPPTQQIAWSRGRHQRNESCFWVSGLCKTYSMVPLNRRNEEHSALTRRAHAGRTSVSNWPPSEAAGVTDGEERNKGGADPERINQSIEGWMESRVWSISSTLQLIQTPNSPVSVVPSTASTSVSSTATSIAPVSTIPSTSSISSVTTIASVTTISSTACRRRIGLAGASTCSRSFSELNEHIDLSPLPPPPRPPLKNPPPPPLPPPPL
ncbi:hypothetical protein DNTS_012306 [Danionella cerebrum]|uniref:Uncharacterized protein n=1 Tax=Danionella cerebrum TaxID=2873325 RepID=A0A553REQ2_9TELE|nr:hypothetical protein DNTS_012306 [Danionella translucida]